MLDMDEEHKRQVEFYIYEQHYLELMEKGQKLEAVYLMQKELVPRCPAYNRNRLHQLAQLITCPTDQEGSEGARELRLKAHWKGSEGGRQALLEKVQSLLPASMMMPPYRLEALCRQALANQVKNCQFHNVHQTQFSLLENHQCSK